MIWPLGGISGQISAVATPDFYVVSSFRSLPLLI